MLKKLWRVGVCVSALLSFRVVCSEGGQDLQGQKAPKCPHTRAHTHTGVFRHFSEEVVGVLLEGHSGLEQIRVN